MSDPREPPAADRTVDERVAENEAKLVEADRRLAVAEAESAALRARMEEMGRAQEMDARRLRRFMRRVR